MIKLYVILIAIGKINSFSNNLQRNMSVHHQKTRHYLLRLQLKLMFLRWCLQQLTQCLYFQRQECFHSLAKSEVKISQQSGYCRLFQKAILISFQFCEKFDKWHLKSIAEEHEVVIRSINKKSKAIEIQKLYLHNNK